MSRVGTTAASGNGSRMPRFGSVSPTPQASRRAAWSSPVAQLARGRQTYRPVRWQASATARRFNSRAVG